MKIEFVRITFKLGQTFFNAPGGSGCVFLCFTASSSVLQYQNMHQFWFGWDLLGCKKDMSKTFIMKRTIQTGQNRIQQPNPDSTTKVQQPIRP